MRSISKIIVLVAWAVLMAACGGGGGGTSPVSTSPPPPPPPPPPPSDFSLIGQVEVPDPTDLWLHGDVVYVGSNLGVSPSPVQVFDISDPSAPQLTSTIEVDARKTNVKISADGSLAVIGHGGDDQSNDGLYEITLLDLADPAQPTVITRFTGELSFVSGVQSVWIDGSVLNVMMQAHGQFDEAFVHPEAAMRIIDISDPAAPQLITTYYGGSSIIWDVHVVNGLAFVGHGYHGLIILDVGNGMAGGSPANPVEIGRESSAGIRFGSPLYWPETGYVFLEGFTGTQDPGQLIVVDARDLQNPRQVATAQLRAFEFPQRFALDKTRQILYGAWSDRGLVAVDVGGVLSGDLFAQGRLLGETSTQGFSLGVQFHKGLIWVTTGSGGSAQLQVYEPTF